MKSIQLYGSKFNTAVVASRPKDEWVKSHMNSHFPGVDEDVRAKRLGEVHEACTAEAKKATAETEKPAQESRPAKQARKKEDNTLPTL